MLPQKHFGTAGKDWRKKKSATLPWFKTFWSALLSQMFHWMLRVNLGQYMAPCVHMLVRSLPTCRPIGNKKRSDLCEVLTQRLDCILESLLLEMEQGTKWSALGSLTITFAWFKVLPKCCKKLSRLGRTTQVTDCEKAYQFDPLRRGRRVSLP